MPKLITCTPCTLRATCERRATIVRAIAGLKLSTIRFACKDRQLPYRRGQSLWTETFECSADDARTGEYDDVGDRYRGWYPATFLGLSTKVATRGLVAIRAGAAPEGDDSDAPGYPFRPMRNATQGWGACSVLWERLRPRDAPDEPLCANCDAPFGAIGCEGPRWYDSVPYDPKCPHGLPRNLL